MSGIMEPLIPLINNLQDVSKYIGEDEFRLPQIVVVGSQGSGKSSVLENIVGRSFLPKGTGIVTRTPLVLQLVHSPKEPGPHRRQDDGTLNVEEYGVFLHSNEIYTDFDDISEEIQRQTNKIAGIHKGISDREIILKLYSPKLANMTLVDLPGLTKLPVGDQPDDVENQIRNLVLKYIDNDNAVILAVLTAYNDMSTNESLKLAKECDPEGVRTVAVLTKVDLMDAGTDATDILMGRVIPVKLGVIAVINRSQKDIDNKKPIAQVYKDEAEFLRKKYPSLAICNGTSFLVATLKKLFLEHMQGYLHNVRGHVEQRIEQLEALVDFYSDDDDVKDKGLMKIITEFSSAYKDHIEESAGKSGITMLPGGQCIFNILYKTLKTELNQCKPTFQEHAILTSVQNAKYYGRGPEEILQELLKAPFIKVQEASLRCADLVCQEMKQLLWKCAYKEEFLIQNFPALRNKILDILENLLHEQYSLAKNAIAEGPFYDLGSKITYICRFDNKTELLNKEQFKIEPEKTACDIIKKHVVSCFESAVRTVHDIVTATVMQNLVYEVKNKVQNQLRVAFASPGLGRIFHGAQDFSKKLIEEKLALQNLYKARSIIEEIDASILNCGTNQLIIPEVINSATGDRGEPMSTPVPCYCPRHNI